MARRGFAASDRGMDPKLDLTLLSSLADESMPLLRPSNPILSLTKVTDLPTKSL